MKLRRTAWLLTLLLSVLGCFGTPAASFTTSRSSYSVVYPDKSGKPHIPGQEIAKSRQAVSQLAENLPAIRDYDDPVSSPILDSSLFQRPPPAAFPRP